jgi:hypothetical protein
MPLLNLLGFGWPVILLMAGGLLAKHVLKAQMANLGAKLAAKPYLAAGIVGALALAALLFWPHKSWLSAGSARVPAKTAHKPPPKKKVERPAKKPKTKPEPIAKASPKRAAPPAVRTPVAAMPGMFGPPLGMGLWGGMGGMPLPGTAGASGGPSAGGGGGGGASGGNPSSGQAAKQQQQHPKGSASSQTGAKGIAAAPKAGLTAKAAGQPKTGPKGNSGPGGAVSSQQKSGAGTAGKGGVKSVANQPRGTAAGKRQAASRSKGNAGVVRRMPYRRPMNRGGMMPMMPHPGGMGGHMGGGSHGGHR